MGRVTIKDVANDAGVSITTASFAINNRTGRISEAAKEKVLASAEKLGYVPNTNARNLRTKTSNSYMLVYDERYLLERNASTLQFVVGAVKYSARREKDLLLRTVPRITNGVQAAEEFMQLWNAKHADGVIFQIGEENKSETNRFYEYLSDKKINFVVISPNGRIDDFPSVYIDDYQLMEEAISYIYSKGYRYVYYLTRKTELKFEKEIGFLHAIQMLRLQGECLYYNSEERNEEDIWNTVKHTVMNRQERIAFACWNDVDAIYLLKALHKHNISVPSQVGVLGFDDIPASEYTTPPLTTVRQPFEEMAFKAIEVLSGNTSVSSYNKTLGVRMRGNLIIRESV